MKYEEQVFNLSADAYAKIKLSNNTENEDILKKQNKLLKILLKKFQEKLNSKKDIGNGILKVRFKSIFWSDFNDGYSEIDELVKSNNFASFASDYCIYIGEVESRCDEERNAYYEIIWDYKTYYEQLSMQQIDITEKLNQKGNSFANAIKDFKQLPIKYQIIILNSFAENVENAKRNNEQNIAVETLEAYREIYNQEDREIDLAVETLEKLIKKRKTKKG